MRNTKAACKHIDKLPSGTRRSILCEPAQRVLAVIFWIQVKACPESDPVLLMTVSQLDCRQRGQPAHEGRSSIMKSIVLESSKRLPLEVRNGTVRASLPGIRARSTRSSGTESDWSNGGQNQMMHA